MADSKNYFDYLRQRSMSGLVYRKYWLYPRLCKKLKGRTLDLGCGVGDMLAYRSNTVGVDINPKTIEWGKTQGFNVFLIEDNKLPFEEKSFDSVILDNVLEHILDPTLILLEGNRVLDEQGVFVVGVPGLLGYSSDSDHKVFYTKEKLIDTVTGFGFSVTELFAMPFNFEWLDTRMRQYCVYAVFKKN